MKIDQLRTPCYVIDEKKMRENLEILKKVQEDTGCRILLAQKAFSGFALYPLIAGYLAGTTASGLFEARLGHEEMGKENHVFSPAYKEEDMEELDQICEITNSFGRTEVVPERLMDAVGAVSGCSPAYVFMFVEAMADAAVAQGMPRKQAYQFAAQSVLGSAKMVLETGMHPGELKDMVCSPAGTTIEGVRILEQNGFRSAVFEALNGAAEKGKKM